MVAADVLLARRILLHRRATEFAAPNDERRIEQAQSLEVLDEPGQR